MNKKRILTLGIVGFAALLVAGLTLTSNVNAAEETEGFGERVRGMFMSEEEREEHHAEVQAQLEQAVEEGTLTQEQLELHDAIREVREGERQARMQERKQEMIQELTDAGYDVSEEELEELHETMQELGYGPRGGQGKRMGGGDCMYGTTE